MLQWQYYNYKLSKSHIEKILTNYTIKYNTMKNEIDAKFNSMIKLFVNDIRAFLENIEEISNERKKIKEAENCQIEIALLKSKLDEKTANENKMKNEIEILNKENSSLKTRIRIQNNLNKQKNLSEISNPSDYILKTESKKIKEKYKNFMTNSRMQLRKKNKDKNLNTSRVTTEGNKPKKHKRSNHLSISIDKRNLKEKDKTKTVSSRFKGSNHSMEKKSSKIKKKTKSI